MSGGSWEYVAAYVDNGDANITKYGLSLSKGDQKTKNVYAKGTPEDQTNNYNANAGKYGDAIYETSSKTYNGDMQADDIKQSWNSDTSAFPYTKYGSFFSRGGYYAASAGVFGFHENNGQGGYYISFRPVLVVI